MRAGDREMTSFSPLNVYTSAAARGEFLRPDVRALLADASVGPFCWVTTRDGQTLQAVPDPRSVVIRERLDALLFPEGLPRPNDVNNRAPQVPDQNPPFLVVIANNRPTAPTNELKSSGTSPKFLISTSRKAIALMRRGRRSFTMAPQPSYQSGLPAL
jgi:hypothetical protein